MSKKKSSWSVDSMLKNAEKAGQSQYKKQSEDFSKVKANTSFTRPASPAPVASSSASGVDKNDEDTSSVAERIFGKLSAAASEMFGVIADRNKPQQDIISGLSDHRGKPSSIDIDARDIHVRQNYAQHEIDSGADSINKLFGDTSNVDYSKRKYLTGADMKKAGWTREQDKNLQDDNVVTTYSSAYTGQDWDDIPASNRGKYLELTPIRDDGTIMSPAELEEYAHNLLRQSDIKSADAAGNKVLMKEFDNPTYDELNSFYSQYDTLKQKNANDTFRQQYYDATSRAVKPPNYNPTVDPGTAVQNAMTHLVASKEDKAIDRRDSSVRTTNEIQEKLPYWTKLAQAGTLTGNDKIEAQHAGEVLWNRTRDISWGKASGTKQEAATYQALAEVLKAKSSGIVTSTLAGAVKSVPFIEKISGAMQGMSGDQVADANGYSDDVRTALTDFWQHPFSYMESSHPAAAEVGEFAGGIGQLAVTGGMYGAAKGLSPVAKTALTFGTVSGLNTASNQIWTEKGWNEYRDRQISQGMEIFKDSSDEVKQDNLDELNKIYGVPYSAWTPIRNTAISAVTGGLAGALGGAASQKVGGAVLSKLMESGLTPRAISGLTKGAGGLAFGAVNAAIVVAGQNAQNGKSILSKDYEVDAASIAKNVAITAIWSALDGIANPGFTTRSNASADEQSAKSYFTQDELSDFSKLQQRYRQYAKEYADVRNSANPDPVRTSELSEITNAYNYAKEQIRMSTSTAVKEEAQAARESGTASAEDSPAVRQAIALLNDYYEFESPAPTAAAASASFARVSAAQSEQIVPAAQAAPAAQSSTTPLPVARPQTNYIQNGVLQEVNRSSVTRMAATLGEHGQKAMTKVYDNGDATAYSGDFIRAYNAGEKGADIDSVQTTALTPQQKFAAFSAGQNDAPAAQGPATAERAYSQNKGNSVIGTGENRLSAQDTSKIENVAPVTLENAPLQADNEVTATHTETEVANNGGAEQQDDLRDRDGGRAIGQPAGGQAQFVETRTGASEKAGPGSAQKETAAQRRAAVQTERAVSTAELDVPGGTRDASLRVVPEHAYDGELRGIEERNRAHGVETTFFTGTLRISDGTGSFTARGAASPDGKRMWVRVDHDGVGASQIAKHEEYHLRVQKDPALNRKLRDAFVAKHGDGALEYLAEYYAGRYFSDENGNVSVPADYILEEVFADMYGGIDVAENIDAAPVRTTDYTDETRQNVEEFGQNSQTEDLNHEREKAAGGQYSRDDGSGGGNRERVESRSEFLERVRGGARRYDEIGGVAYDYIPVRSYELSLSAEKAGKELKALGVKYFFHDGLEINDGDVTQKDIGDAATICSSAVGVYCKAYGVGKEIAGHEAFHVWEGSESEKSLVELMRKNFTYSIFTDEQVGEVLEKYFDDKLPENTEERAAFALELYARMAGYIHGGQKEEQLRTSFKDYDAVKAAWEQVVAENSAGGEKNTAGKTRFSIDSPVEATKDLVALHNLSEEKLTKALDLGGFPMPSIAITKANIPHTNFGDITLVMDKNAIDPKTSSKNEAYSADAWTPTFPQIEYEPNEKAAGRIRTKYYELSKKVGYDAARPLYKYANTIEDALNNEGGESGILERLRDDTSMMQVYLADVGKAVTPVTTETVTRLDDATVRWYQHLISVLGENVVKDTKPRGGESPISRRKAWLQENGDKLDEAYASYLRDVSGLSEEEARNAAEAEPVMNKMRQVVGARNYLNGGAETRKTEYDAAATEAAIRAAAGKSSYEKWLTDLFDGIEKGKGVRNGKDPYTAIGNSRSFGQTHYAVTLGNITKAMAAQNGGDSRNVSGFYGIKSLRAGTAERFGSIADMHAAEGRLQHLTQEQSDQVSNELENRLVDIISRLDALHQGSEPNQFIRADRIGNILMEAAGSKTHTIDSIEKVFAEYGYHVGNPLAEDIRNLFFDVTQMPVNIFEAKPKRSVHFDEVLAAVVPDSTGAELRSRLDAVGVPVIEYKDGDTDSRIEAVNSVQGARFSRDDETEARERDEFSDAGVRFSMDTEPPKKSLVGYKVFVAKDGKLYPPVVDAKQETPVGVWIKAKSAEIARDKDGEPVMTKFGRNKVKSRLGALAYRPGWHLGEFPIAKQFYEVDKDTGEHLMHPDYVWAECEFSADREYQQEADAMSTIPNQKSLDYLPEGGYYKFRTNPDPTTEAWYIAGSMKVHRILTDDEVNEILVRNGKTPMNRRGGPIDLSAFGFDNKPIDENRFSRDAANPLQEQNAALREKVGYWKGQTKRTAENTVRRADTDKIANSVLKEYDSSFDKDERKAISDRVKELGDYLVGQNISYEEAKDRALGIARDIVGSASVLADSDGVRNYKAIRAYLKDTKLFFNDKSDIADFEDFRRRHFGKFTISAAGLPVDTAYQELSETFGESYFPSDITHPADQLLRIAEVVDSMGPVYENPYSYYMAEASEYLANDILDQLLSDSVRQTTPTFADRQAAKLASTKAAGQQRVAAVTERLNERSAEKIAKVKESDAERLDALRQQKNERIAQITEQGRERTKQALQKERASRDEKIARLKEKNAESRAKAAEKRKETAMRARIAKRAGDLSQKLLNPTDKKHIPEELRGAVSKVLEAINLESGFDVGENGHVERGSGAPTKRTAAFAALREAYGKIGGDLVLDPDLMGGDGATGLLDDVIAMSETPIANMNLAQLTTVYETLRAVDASVKTAGQMFSAQRWETVSDAAEALRKDNGSKTPPTEFKGISNAQKLARLDMLTPEAYFHRLGGSGDQIFRMLRNAQDKHILIMKAASDWCAANLKGIDVPKLEKEIHTVALGGQKVRLSKAQLMELYVLYRREQAVNHIFAGGILPDVAEGKGIRKISATEPVRGITVDEITKALSLLTADEAKAAASMQRYLSSDMAEYGNQASMEVYDYRKFNEAYYWPIRTNRQEIRTTVEKDTQVTSVANKGMTKATVPNANTSLRIGSIFDSFSTHVSEMATYAAWLGTTEDVSRIINYTYRNDEGVREGTVKGIMANVFGRDIGEQYAKKLLSDISIGVHGAEQEYMGGITANFKAAAVGANLRVIIQQPTAILRAMDMIDPQYLVIGTVSPLKGWDKALQYAPIAQWKDWGYFDVDTGRKMKDVLFGSSGVIEDLRQKAMWGAGMADSLAWGQLWNACEAETKAKYKDLRPGSSEYYDHVAKRFTEIVDHTQVVDGILQRSQIMRSTSGLTKMATAFMGEPTKQYNMFMSAAYDTQHATGAAAKTAKQRLARTLVALLVSGVVNAAAQSIMDAARDSDKDKDYWEKWLESFFGFTGDEDGFAAKWSAFWSGNLESVINPAQYIVYAKDIVSILQGYDVTRMDMESVEKVSTAVKNFMKAISGEGKYTVAGASADLFSETARLLGLPVSNVKRDVLALAQTAAIQSKNYVMQYKIDRALYSISGNSGEYLDILYNAYKNDHAAYEKIYADMVKSGFDEKKIQTGMENREKKAEGVTKTEDLESRFVSPDVEASYEASLDTVKNSPVYTGLDDKAKKEVDDWVYQAATGTLPDDTQKKADAAAEQGIDSTYFVLYKAALKMYDADKNGSIKQEEAREAIDAIGNLTEAQRSFLWQSTNKGWKEKNNPYS